MKKGQVFRLTVYILLPVTLLTNKQTKKHSLPKTIRHAAVSTAFAEQLQIKWPQWRENKVNAVANEAGHAWTSV